MVYTDPDSNLYKSVEFMKGALPHEWSLVLPFYYRCSEQPVVVSRGTVFLQGLLRAVNPSTTMNEYYAPFSPRECFYSASPRSEGLWRVPIPYIAPFDGLVAVSLQERKIKWWTQVATGEPSVREDLLFPQGPSVQDGRIFVLSSPWLLALDVDAGGIVARIRLGHCHSCTLAGGNAYVLFGKLEAKTPRTAAQKRHWDSFGPPDRERLFVGCVDLTSFALRWSREVGIADDEKSSGLRMLHRHGGLLFVAYLPEEESRGLWSRLFRKMPDRLLLVAIDEASGEIRSSHRIGCLPFLTWATFDRSRLFLASSDVQPSASQLTCIDLDSFRTLWSVPVECAGSPPSLGADQLILAHDGGLVCLERNTGAELWRKDEGAVARPAIHPGRGLVFCHHPSGYLHAYSLESGALQHRLPHVPFYREPKSTLSGRPYEGICTVFTEEQNQVLAPVFWDDDDRFYFVTRYGELIAGIHLEVK